jgi:hypothetical protein
LVPTASHTSENPPANIEALQLSSQSGKSLLTHPSAQNYSLTEQKRAVSNQSKRLMAFSAFIIVRNPVGTLIAILQTE